MKLHYWQFIQNQVEESDMKMEIYLYEIKLMFVKITQFEDLKFRFWISLG